MDSSRRQTRGAAALLELGTGASAAALLEPMAGWLQQLPPDRRLYVLMQELAFSVQALNRLGELFNALSHINPRVLCVPLLPAAGWTHDKVSALADLQHVVVTGQQQQQEQQQQGGDGDGQATALLQQLAACRPAGLPLLTALHVPQQGQVSAAGTSAASSTEAAPSQPEAPTRAAGGAPAPAAGPEPGPTGMLAQPIGSSGASSAAQQQHAHSASPAVVDPPPTSSSEPLQFSRVALGGTFDRLHSGHELLLAAAALVSTQYVFVGVTADALLAKKAHRELLEPYDARLNSAMAYMAAVNPSVQLQAGPLSDPKEPTMAELDPGMEAIVVSSETVPGAKAINQGRVGRGLQPLTVVVVPVIGLGQHSGQKLSSTDLRAMLHPVADICCVASCYLPLAKLCCEVVGCLVRFGLCWKDKTFSHVTLGWTTSATNALADRV